MAKSQINMLSAKEVLAKSDPGYYCDGGGLYLQVSKQGTKSWVFRFKSPVTFKTRDMGLGSLHTISLAMARAKALEARIMLDKLIDPIEEKHRNLLVRKQAAQQELMTFRVCTERCIKTLESGWKNEKHKNQWITTLETYAYPVIGDKPVRDIDEQMVLQILSPIWLEKHETANRLRGRIEKVLDYAEANKYRTGLNPARWKGNLRELLGTPKIEVVNQPALPYARIPEFMPKLRSHNGNAAKALEFTILTGTRSGEVRLATWSEFDLNAGKWTIPAGRMKAKKEHIVPLSDQAIELLKHQPHMDGCEFVFFAPRGGALSDMALTSLIRKMHAAELKSGGKGFTDPSALDAYNNQRVITAHGFRSTFRDWAGETTNFPREVIERSLAHRIKDKAEEAYARGSQLEKRIKLMQSWADYCDKTEIAGVVQLAAANK